MNYEQQAKDFAQSHNVKLVINHSKYGKYFPDDTEKRHIFNCTLFRGKNQYTFNFGQSIAEGANEPTMYAILSCLQKYDVGTLDNFCSEFGYNKVTDWQAKVIYNKVCREFAAMQRLFTSDELELLQEIN